METYVPGSVEKDALMQHLIYCCLVKRVLCAPAFKDMQATNVKKPKWLLWSPRCTSSNFDL